MKKIAALFLVAFLLVSGSVLRAQNASIKEEKQTIKTYPFSGGDPTPIMTRSSMWGRGQKLYPYYFLDEMSVNGKDQPWNVVHMENPYIDVFVLPAEGGKLLGAVEKSTKNTFIYYNHVRKYRQIALRGPWTSGGIEFNFGVVGHQATTATPVDYMTRKNPDGSVSCIVGIMDLPSRTHWSVTITVPKDKAYFETRSLFYNPTLLDQAYYVWMNSANKGGDDLEFVFPGTSYIGHDYSAPERPWPVGENGRDLSFLKNHNYEGAPGSLFIFGKLEDFAGGYWHNSQFGFGHWALYEDMPGHKFFHWSLAPSGDIWRKLLTDTDGQYIEPQMGRLFDQNDHEFLTPYSADHWREVWFPYKQIGPMVKASPSGALNVKNGGGSLSVGFCPLQKIDDDLVVISKGKEVFREHLRLKPMEVFQKTLPLTVEKGSLQVKIGKKLSYADDPETNLLKRPINFRNYDETSLEGLFQAAERNHRARYYELALTKYLACLERDPLHGRALVRAAEIYCWQGEYEKALPFVQKALDHTMYDPDANYIYSVVSRKLGRLVDARETLGWAARSMKYRSAAYCQMAELYMMGDQLDLAEEYTKRSLDYNTYNVRAYQVQATTYRMLGQPDMARQTLEKLLELDPLNHLARFEQYLLQPGDKNLTNFKSMIRNEMPHETYLETALYYANLKLDGDAVKVLEVAPEYPTLVYWHAYLLREKNPAKSKELLAKASRLSPNMVFPYREESIPVFKWAKGMQPDDWKPGYYLGLIYWGKSRYEDVQAEFAGCGDKPDYAAFYVSRGFLQKGTNAQKAEADYERALALDKKDWRNWHQAIGFYNERSKFDKSLALSGQARKLFPEESVITVDAARSSMNSRRFQDCYEALKSATILPYEGQQDVHTLFVNCELGMALAAMKKADYSQAIKFLEESKDYPERLGTGKPYNPDYRLQDFLLTYCYEKTGDKQNLEAARKRIFDYAPSRGVSEKPEVLKRKVDQWYQTVFPRQDELKALDALTQMIRERRGRGN